MAPRLILPSPKPFLVMGVLNVTPDSFSDGGRYQALDSALRQIDRMVAEGADIIDIGGESTRPGSQPVSEQHELERVVPVLERLGATRDFAVSIDTSKPAVMDAAARAGADMINDVRALQRPGALQAASAAGIAVCLMHMQGEPSTMQRDPRYGDVTGEVTEFLAARASACLAAGIPRERIVVDPGFGFGKRTNDNLLLLRELDRIVTLGFPIMAGLSRKSLVGELTGRPVEDRVHGSVALAVLAFLHGACIIRAHDVGPTVDALRVAAAVAAS
jgi:dihydropteroate synthase